MEDPGLRDPISHATTVVIPSEFYRRKLTQERSRIAACERANTAMWSAYTAANGSLNITTYLAESGPAVFGPGRTALACWTVRHPENAALLRALQKATGAATCKAA